MSLAHLVGYFNVVNPHGGANPHGNCARCAIETADALTEGRRPNTIGNVNTSVALAGRPTLREFSSDVHNRADVVLIYFLIAAPAGVYAVESEDHAYNFVVLPNRLVYLVDSNQQVFRRVQNVGDFQAVGHNATLLQAYNYDYGNPDTDGDSDMDIYYWGGLHPRWHLVLTQTGNNAWLTPNGTFRQVQTTGRGSKTLD